MRETIDRWGGRKWVTAIGSLLIGTVLEVLGGFIGVRLLTPELVSLYVGIVGLFFGSNALVHRGYAKAGAQKDVPSVSDTASPVDA